MWGVRLRHQRHAEVPSPVATMPCITKHILWKETNHKSHVQPVDTFLYMIMYIVKGIVAEYRDQKFPARCTRTCTVRTLEAWNRRAGYKLQ